MSLRDLHVATSDAVACRRWLRRQGLLSMQMQCGWCGSVMEERPYSHSKDGIVWCCPSRDCRATSSIRKRLFFERSHLPLDKLLDLTSLWCLDVSNKDIEQQVCVTC